MYTCILHPNAVTRANTRPNTSAYSYQWPGRMNRLCWKFCTHGCRLYVDPSRKRLLVRTHTYLPTYIHTYIHTDMHAYIQTNNICISIRICILPGYQQTEAACGQYIHTHAYIHLFTQSPLAEAAEGDGVSESSDEARQARLKQFAALKIQKMVQKRRDARSREGGCRVLASYWPALLMHPLAWVLQAVCECHVT